MKIWWDQARVDISSFFLQAITEALNPKDRQKIYQAMQEMVQEIEEDPRNLQYYFPGRN